MLANLRALFVRVVDIVLLRRGPESLPASSTLLAIVVALNVAVAALLNSILPSAPPNWASQLLVSTFVPLLWFRLAFVLAKKPERFLQTMMAFFGANLLFLPALVPLVSALLPYIGNQDPAVVPPAGLSLLGAFFAVWLLIVWVRAVHAAFGWPYFAAAIFIFGQNFAAAAVYALLFGVPQA